MLKFDTSAIQIQHSGRYADSARDASTRKMKEIVERVAGPNLFTTEKLIRLTSPKDE